MANAGVDFFVFTDDRRATSKGNLYVEYMSFESFVQQIQKAVDFDISVRKPYKLCDCKPAYGLAFKDMLAGYDFWGYCDIDLIFGDIRKFVTDDILESSDRIYSNGHLSLYRNNYMMNTLFLQDGLYPEYNAREALSLDEPCYFDEYRGMELKSLRILEKGRFYDNREVRLDLRPDRLDFYDKSGNKVYCEWNKGRLFVKGDGVADREMLYVHFQKRQIHSPCGGTENENAFLLIPNSFSKCSEHIVYRHGLPGNMLYGFRFKCKQLRKALCSYSMYDIVRRKKRQRDTFVYRKSIVDTKQV